MLALRISDLITADRPEESQPGNQLIRKTRKHSNPITFDEVNLLDDEIGIARMWRQQRGSARVIAGAIATRAIRHSRIRSLAQ